MVRDRIGRLITPFLDLFAEDHCVLCQSPATTGPLLVSDRRRLALVSPVPIHLGGIATAYNRPVCDTCVTRFVVAIRPGRVADPAGEGPAIEVVAPFMTGDPVLVLVRLLKFAGYRELARPMADAIAAACVEMDVRFPGGTVLAAVPMDPASMRARGFNQAALIADRLSQLFAIEPVTESLRKKLRTRAQSTTPIADRVANVDGVFDVRSERISGRHVVLVDDLVTSGATIHACGAVLRRAGASSVTAISFGRAL